MKLNVEYFFADTSSRFIGALSRDETIKAVEEFPWKKELANFAEGGDTAGPEVRFARLLPDNHEEVEAFASISKFENETWFVLGHVTLPGKILGIFPTTKKVDILLDNQSWQDIRDFIKRFFESTRADLFRWMKERE